MRPISRSVHDRRGARLPSPWPGLDEVVEIREGDAVTVLGAPMSNKSNLMLNWLIREDIPAIFGSFDTPIMDMTARSLSIMTGHPTSQVFDGMAEGKYDEYADQQTKLWFTDDSSLLIPDRKGNTLLEELTTAYKEFLGEPPKVIVLDNLSDTAAEVHHVALQTAFKMARTVGAKVNAAVFALHHVKRPPSDESKDPASVPVRLNDGVSAGERDASVVLGLWKPKFGEQRVLRIAHLKSKRREADPAGGLYVDFELDQSRSWIGDVIEDE